MTKRIVVLPTLAALLIGLAVAPASYAKQAPKKVAHRHFLKMYKVEKVLDIEGDEYVHNSDSHVYCDDNGTASFADDDIAIDGMWKIVDVDQDDDGTRHYTDVRVYASYNDGTEQRKWHFEFDNRNEGRAQLKLYATCLGWKTEPNSHQHEWTVSSQFTRDQTYQPADVPPAVGPSPVRYTFDTFGDDCATDRGAPGGPDGDFDDHSYVLVTPGYQWTGTGSGPGVFPDSGYGDIDASRPYSGNVRDWLWRFWVQDAGRLRVSWRCLKIPSSNYSDPPSVFNHYHNIDYEFSPSFPAPLTNPAHDPNSVETRTRACDEHYKGVLHSFDLDNATGHHLWFLGMDPRIKKRAYRIQNKDSFAHDSQLGVICFQDRTGRRKAV